MRLSTEGSLYTCLFAQSGHDLKSLLRAGASDDEIRNEIAAVWQGRTDRYSEIRTAETAKAKKSRCPTSVATWRPLGPSARLNACLRLGGSRAGRGDSIQAAG